MRHDERELRYLRPEGWVAPERLIGLVRLGEQTMPHTDVYYEAFTAKGRPVLAAKRVNVRARHLGGSSVLTLKRKRTREGKATVRGEWTENLMLGRLDSGSPLMRRIRSLVDGRELRPHLVIEVVRRDVHYLSREAGHLVLSEDQVTYEDGSVEHRLEVEIAAGDPSLLAVVHRELKMHYPHIRIAKRGKYSEAKLRAARGAPPLAAGRARALDATPSSI